MDCICIGFVAVGCVYKEEVEAFSGDLGIPLVVIRLGLTGLKKTTVVYLLELFQGRGEKGQCDLVCVEHLNGSYVDVLLKRAVSVVLVLWAVGPILSNGYGD